MTHDQPQQHHAAGECHHGPVDIHDDLLFNAAW
jgi:hypothetical protein